MAKCYFTLTNRATFPLPCQGTNSATNPIALFLIRQYNPGRVYVLPGLGAGAVKYGPEKQQMVDVSLCNIMTRGAMAYAASFWDTDEPPRVAVNAKTSRGF
jgi:hypothetical protein